MHTDFEKNGSFQIRNGFVSSDWLNRLTLNKGFQIQFQICTICKFSSPKMKFLSLFTRTHVVPNPQDLCSSLEHNLRFLMNGDAWNGVTEMRKRQTV